MSAHLVERSEEDSFTAVVSHLGDLLNEGQVGSVTGMCRGAVMLVSGSGYCTSIRSFVQQHTWC